MSENALFAAIAALVCLPLALALAAAGLPAISAVLLFSLPKRVKVFRDKFGQQTATFCLLAGLVSLVCLGAAAVLLQTRFPAAASFWLGWPLPLAPLAACLALAGALAVAYRASWQNLKDNRPLHASLGLAATASAWTGGYLFLTFFRHFAVSPALPAADPALFLPPAASAAWPLLPALLGLSLCLAGAAGSLYLISRRDKDDFGRDYYNYALKLACKWSLFPAAAALAALAGLFFLLWPAARDLPLRPVFFWGHAAALTAFGLAMALWGMVLRNQNPLRLKLHCLAALILTVLGMAGVGLALSRFFFG